MTIQVAMPKLGLLMTEGVIVKWLVADGQSVTQDQPIVNIMTKKITYQVVAPGSGILHHAAQVNERVLIGDPIAFIAAPGEPIPFIWQAVHRETPKAAMHITPPSRPSAGQFVLASPWARHLAHELGVELAKVKGTGFDGCIVGRDVSHAAAARNHPPTHKLARPTADIHSVPFTGMRRIIAQRLTESLHNMAPATLNVEADITEMIELRKQIYAQAPPTHTDVMIKAVTMALKNHPQLNAVLLGDEVELLKEIHIGVAVQLKDGLLVPVIRNADRRTVAEIATERRRLIKAAHAGTLTVDDAAGSTFTVTDLGVYGIDSFVPIINPPEAAILGIGRVAKKPLIWRNGFVARATVMLCLTFDHRVVDGAPAAAFLRTITRLLARPQRLFE